MAVTDLVFKPEVFRKDHPMVIAQNMHLSTREPVRLAYNASGYKAGRVLGRNSTSGYYQNYDDSASSGLNTAVCVLFEDVDVTEIDGGATGTALARAIFGGELFQDKLLGLDAAAIVDLKARSFIDATGTTVLKF